MLWTPLCEKKNCLLVLQLCGGSGSGNCADVLFHFLEAVSFNGVSGVCFVLLVLL